MFYWDTGPRYGHLTCDSDKPVPIARPVLSSVTLSTVPGVAACNAYDPARRYLTVGHCPKSLDRLSNLTSAQKKAKKHLKEARSEAQTAVLQRFWVKSAIGRIIGRDCS